ncbi:OmpH family outer membrane protein [Mesoflavibacter sp. CH_XMU1422-2]|uniref:OmpH family outer membrane protein n=1 Tax=Mesoflavibacter sp. CH_XMU1422-2 TaxID=3107770 RepID=UPI00300A9EF2
MKFKVLLVLFILSVSFQANAQRGVRIGYIDTEYILENVPEYTEATKQLESKVQKWKTEIEGRLNTVKQKREALNNEKALLTKELIEEREEDILFEEKEILDYQQKRFGPNGDLMIQKKQLMQPVQDQIFQAVQDIAANKKYDFIFDKSADVVMLYSAERFDISDLVIRTITRASKRKQATNRKERKEAKEEEVVEEVNDSQEARQKALDEKRAAREAAAEKRRQEIFEAREAKKKAAQEKRQKLIEERAKAREEKLKARQETKDEENPSFDGDENNKEEN